jgi:hypothetical protein
VSEEIPQIAANLADCEALSVGEYAEYLANDLKRSIGKRFPALKKTFAINLLLDGFFDQEPGRAKAVITCGPRPVPVRVESQELFPGKSIGFGSRLIHEALFAPSHLATAIRSILHPGAARLIYSTAEQGSVASCGLQEAMGKTYANNVAVVTGARSGSGFGSKRLPDRSG